MSGGHTPVTGGESLNMLPWQHYTLIMKGGAFRELDNSYIVPFCNTHPFQSINSGNIAFQALRAAWD